MKHVEIRRHTDNDGDRLSAEGVAAAERIGRSGLQPSYALFVSTGAARAAQMLAILRSAARQEDVPTRAETGLRSTLEDRWREARKATGGGDLEAVRRVDPHLVEQESAVLAAALGRLVHQREVHRGATCWGVTPGVHAYSTNSVVLPASSVIWGTGTRRLTAMPGRLGT